MGKTGRERRAYFRVRYPRAERPGLTVGDGEYQVVELSERGLVLYDPQYAFVQRGEPVAGIITFHDASHTFVEGVLARRDQTMAIIVRLSGITFSRVLREQRFLRKYPGLDLLNEGD